MWMKLCSKCGERAEIELDYARMHLCDRCFVDFYERKVRETVKKYKMIGKEDKVAVAVSGGKDSAALLFVLRKLFPDLSITAVHINVEIPAYSEECEQKFRELARIVGVDSIVYNTREKLGITTPDFQKTVYKDRICSPCGTIKRYLLNKIALENGFTKVATGHNLDDTVEVLFNLYVQGDIQQLVRLRPVAPSTHPKLVTKIKPLIEMTEKENLLYALKNQLPFKEAPCPLASGSRSRERKKLLEMIEGKMRGFKHTLFSSHVKRILPVLEEGVKLPSFVECSSCGMPSSEDPCAFCRRIKMVKGNHED